MHFDTANRGGLSNKFIECPQVAKPMHTCPLLFQRRGRGGLSIKQIYNALAVGCDINQRLMVAHCRRLSRTALSGGTLCADVVGVSAWEYAVRKAKM